MKTLWCLLLFIGAVFSQEEGIAYQFFPRRGATRPEGDQIIFRPGMDDDDVKNPSSLDSSNQQEKNDTAPPLQNPIEVGEGDNEKQNQTNEGIQDEPIKEEQPMENPIQNSQLDEIKNQTQSTLPLTEEEYTTRLDLPDDERPPWFTIPNPIDESLLGIMEENALLSPLHKEIAELERQRQASEEQQRPPIIEDTSDDQE